VLDPLEQFDIVRYKCIFFTNLHYCVLIICFGLGLFLFFSGGYSGYRQRKPDLVLFRDRTFGYLLSILKENMNIKIVLFFPVLYLTFLFLLCSNLLGLIPYSYTITSSAAIAFFFSITFFVGVSLVGYQTHKDTFFQILLPAGVPLILAPFLIIVEAVSYTVKVFSLGGRLFANMLAGHSLLKVLGTMCTAIIFNAHGPLPVCVFPLAVVLLVITLEVAVAFLQAYVFIVLVCIYLNDAVCIH
jgi:F-type H+-transporting ATPase subunit a